MRRIRGWRAILPGIAISVFAATAAQADPRIDGETPSVTAVTSAAPADPQSAADTATPVQPAAATPTDPAVESEAAATDPAGTAAQADPRADAEDAAEAEAPPDPSTYTCSAENLDQRGIASWYGRHWRGRRTASGRRFDERRLTAASRSLPLATRARVTNLRNGRSVDVLVNDRGPYVGGRIIDLSARAAQLLGMTRTGLAYVAITALPAPNSSGGSSI